MSGNIRTQSSQLAEPLRTDPGIKSRVSGRELISTLKKRKKKRRREMNGRTFSQNSRKRGKSHYHHCLVDTTCIAVLIDCWLIVTLVESFMRLTSQAADFSTVTGGKVV